MNEYANKQQLTAAIKEGAAQYLKEFDAIAEADKNLRLEGEDRTPAENLAYQLGWLDLIAGWEEQEQAGQTPAMPAPGIKWNKIGLLYPQFYAKYSGYSLRELQHLLEVKVEQLGTWLDTFTEDELFKPGGRNWAQTTPSNWPVWKWVHINTVAPYKTFRSKIRKWKKLRETV